MAKNTPAFQFYPSDFLGGVMLVSNEGVGVYMKLLSALWISGNLLPFCYDKLSVACLTTATEFERIWPEIESKFEVIDGNVSHQRFSKMIDLAEKRRSSGSKGGKSKAAKSSKTPSKQGSKTLANSRRVKNEERSMKNEELKLLRNARELPIPDSLNEPEFVSTWDLYCDWWLAQTDSDLDSIKGKLQLDGLASSGLSKAIADLRLTMEKAREPGSIWDSSRTFGVVSKSTSSPKTFQQMGRETTANAVDQFLTNRKAGG